MVMHGKTDLVMKDSFFTAQEICRFDHLNPGGFGKLPCPLSKFFLPVSGCVWAKFSLFPCICTRSLYHFTWEPVVFSLSWQILYCMPWSVSINKRIKKEWNHMSLLRG